MSTVQPLRERRQIDAVKLYLRNHPVNTTHDNPLKYYMLWIFGIHTGLRISDIVPLRVSDVMFRNHVVIRERKTGKHRMFRLSSSLQLELEDYCQGMEPDAYLFGNNQGGHLSRQVVYRVLNKVCNAVGIREKIGTHTMRKTFGYHLYQATKDVALLQMILNHSHPSVTLRYIGIQQDRIDAAIMELAL